jgi:6-pyruvoyltetrahydropterin/6-carboxytetrahydropterin synthase
MFVTRRVEFSASHVCRSPQLSDAQNTALYGPEARPNGHGHNYILEVTVEGETDPVTGMVIDLKRLKGILEEQIVEPMDHRFLNAEVTPFEQIIPTAENVAQEIWRRLTPVLNTPTTSLSKVRLYETPELYVDVLRQERWL